MRPRVTIGALAIVVVAVVLQTTLFERIHPFGVAPELVLLTVIAVSLYLQAEEALLVGFTAGLLSDLLGTSLLGTWALVLTAVAFATVRLRDRIEGNVLLGGLGVLVVSAGALLLYSLLSTLFDQRTLTDARVIRIIILASLYNLVLATALVPGVARLLRRERPIGGALT